MLSRICGPEKRCETQLQARRKDAATFPAEISLTPLSTENGLRVATILRDLTQRIEAEAQRAQLIREQAARAQAEQAQ